MVDENDHLDLLLLGLPLLTFFWERIQYIGT